MQRNVDLIIQRRAPVNAFVNIAKNIDDALKCDNFGNISTGDLFRIVKLIKNISIDTASNIFKMSYQKQGAPSLALLEAFDFPENLAFNVLSIFSPLVHIPLFNKIYMMSKMDEREIEVDWEKQYKIEKMKAEEYKKNAEEYKEKIEKELKELRSQNKTLDKDIRVIVKNNILRVPVKDDEKLPTIAMIGKNGRGIEELYYRLRTGSYSKYSPPIESEQAILLNAGKKKPSARLLFLPVNAYEGKNLEGILSKCIAGYCFYETGNKESIRYLEEVISRSPGIPLYLIAFSDDGAIEDSPDISRITACYEFRDHQGISTPRRKGIEHLDDFASRALKEKNGIKLIKKNIIPTFPETKSSEKSKKQKTKDIETSSSQLKPPEEEYCGSSKTKSSEKSQKQKIISQPLTTDIETNSSQLNHQNIIDQVKTSEISISSSNFDEEKVKILTLGTGECGKTTLLNQLKILYCGGFRDTERKSLCSEIKISVMSDIINLISAAEENGISLKQDIKSDIDYINTIDTSDPDKLDETAARAISRIWNDPLIRKTYEESNSIGIGENAFFFLDNIARISEDSYTPTDEDILKAGIRTIGVSDLKFSINDIPTLFVDVGGQKNERRMWSNCLIGVDYVLFVVSLSDFDQYLFENVDLSRTQDSMDTLSAIANTPLLSDKPFFLVLNKYDIFQKKIKSNPAAFERTYPGFMGDINDESACLDHIKSAFHSKLEGRGASAWVEMVPTCAIDQNSVRKLFQNIARKVLEEKK